MSHERYVIPSVERAVQERAKDAKALTCVYEEPPLHVKVIRDTFGPDYDQFGVVPGSLHSILPFPVDYQPYTFAHVVNQLQLLAFAALGFVVRTFAELTRIIADMLLPQ